MDFFETIVLKGVAKEPAERYATAQELADDSAPCGWRISQIVARQPTLAGRAVKWAERHRSIVRAGIAFVFAIVAVMAVSAFLVFGAYQREKHEHAAAVANATQATENAANAQKNYETARQVVRQVRSPVSRTRK